MSLQDRFELENTREKLRWLEQRYAEVERESAGDRHIRELTLLSFKRRINQLKEEIARYEARAGSAPAPPLTSPLPGQRPGATGPASRRRCWP